MIPLLSIAVCDDEALQRDMLEKMLREYYGENANIDVYSDGRRLLDAVERSGRDLYDIYILDVIMPAMTGIELGERLRGMGIRSPIIFLTNSKEYAVDSYSVRAFHYLIKAGDKGKDGIGLKQRAGACRAPELGRYGGAHCRRCCDDKHLGHTLCRTVLTLGEIRPDRRQLGRNDKAAHLFQERRERSA